MAGTGKPRPGIAAFHRGDDFLEVSIDVGEHFSYISRGAIYLLQEQLSSGGQHRSYKRLGAIVNRTLHRKLVWLLRSPAR